MPAKFELRKAQKAENLPNSMKCFVLYVVDRKTCGALIENRGRHLTNPQLLDSALGKNMGWQRNRADKGNPGFYEWSLTDQGKNKAVVGIEGGAIRIVTRHKKKRGRFTSGGALTELYLTFEHYKEYTPITGFADLSEDS